MTRGAVIYHNPRCSKSRETLNLLQERGIAPEVVLYLETPPTESRLIELIEMLGVPPLSVVRKKEAAFASSGLGPDSSARDVARAIVRQPILLERPIVVIGDRAAIGRPPENVLSLL